MASWQDQIPQFSGYISQVPVQEYGRAEAYKQGKYDQGVQSIQNYMDQTTGLSVDPKYKDYLQQSVSSLQDQIKKVSGSDFSNMQLVNQIGGAASKIASDPIIKNGLISAYNWQDQTDSRKQAQKSGKSSVANDTWLDDQYNSWRQDPDLSTPFSGKYVPYTDLNKKYIGVIKDLHADEKLQDIPFETLTDKDGNLSVGKVYDVMTKQGISGIQPSKIVNAIKATMTPDDLQQMAINAHYQFRGASSDDLVKNAEMQYHSSVTQMTNALADAKAKLPSVLGNPTQSAQLKSIIDDYTSQLDPVKGSLVTNYKNAVDIAKNNPDQAKTEIYKNGLLSEYGTAFSWQKESTEYVASPYTAVDHWNKEFALSNEKFEWNKQNDLIKNDLDTAKLQLESEKANGKVVPGITTAVGMGVNIPSATQAMVNDAQSYSMNAAASRQQLKSSLGNKDMTDAELDTKLNAYQKGDLSQFTYPQRQAADNAIKSTNNAAEIQRAVDDARTKAESEVYKTTPKPENMLSNIHNLIVNNYGVKTVITPKEMYDYALKEKVLNYSKYDAITGSTPVGTTYKTINQEGLSPHEQLIYKLISSEYGIFPKTGDPVVSKLMSEIAPILQKTKETQSKVNDLMEQDLSTRNSSWVPRIDNLQVPTEQATKGMVSNISAIVTAKRSEGTSNQDAHLDDLEKWLGDEKQWKNLNFMHYVQGASQQLWVKNGTEMAQINLTDQQASQLIPASKLPNGVVQEIQRKLDLGAGRTNSSGLHENAVFRQSDMPNIKSLNVTADLERAVGGNDVYIQAHIQTPSGWKTITLKDPLDINGAMKGLSALDDRTLINSAIKSLDKLGQDDLIAELKSMIK